MVTSRCIVLNANMAFIHVTRDTFDGVKLVAKGAATALATYPGPGARSEHGSIPVPAVAVLRRYARVGRRRPAFSFASKRNVLIRDEFQCAYCGRALTMGTCTLDHVVPKSRGGRGDLENLVACCTMCNAQKDDRTPDEARMPLRRRPRQLTDEEKLGAVLKVHRSHERDAWMAALKENGLSLF